MDDDPDDGSNNPSHALYKRKPDAGKYALPGWKSGSVLPIFRPLSSESQLSTAVIAISTHASLLTSAAAFLTMPSARTSGMALLTSAPLARI